MRIMKRFIIWAVLMLVAAFCLNTAGTVVVKVVLSNTLTSALVGYSKKGESMLHPTLKEPDEKNKTNGLSGLAIRALLGDIRLYNNPSFLTNFVFLNGNMDQTTIMFDKNGMSEFSKGIFANVYEKKDGSIDYMRNAVGLISVRDFAELDCAKEICETLENYPDAVVKLDAYSISSLTVQPASLTILDGNDSLIKTYECPNSGEIVKADNVYIYDKNYNGSDGNELHSFCNDLNLAFIGERRTDKIAEKLIDEVDFSAGDCYVHKSGFGFGHYTSKNYEITGDYAMITVCDFSFIKGVLLYMALLSVPIALPTFLIGRKKKDYFY